MIIKVKVKIICGLLHVKMISTLMTSSLSQRRKEISNSTLTELNAYLLKE